MTLFYFQNSQILNRLTTWIGKNPHFVSSITEIRRKLYPVKPGWSVIPGLTKHRGSFQSAFLGMRLFFCKQRQE